MIRSFASWLYSVVRRWCRWKTARFFFMRSEFLLRARSVYQNWCVLVVKSDWPCAFHLDDELVEPRTKKRPQQDLFFLSLSLSLGRCNYHSLMAIMSYCHKIYEVVFRPQVGHFQQVNLPPNDPAVNNQARNLVNRWVKLHLSKSLERLCPPSLGHTVKQLISSKNQYASRTNDHNG